MVYEYQLIFRRCIFLPNIAQQAKSTPEVNIESILSYGLTFTKQITYWDLTIVNHHKLLLVRTDMWVTIPHPCLSMGSPSGMTHPQLNGLNQSGINLIHPGLHNRPKCLRWTSNRFKQLNSGISIPQLTLNGRSTRIISTIFHSCHAMLKLPKELQTAHSTVEEHASTYS